MTNCNIIYNEQGYTLWTFADAELTFMDMDEGSNGLRFDDALTLNQAIY